MPQIDCNAPEMFQALPVEACIQQVKLGAESPYLTFFQSVTEFNKRCQLASQGGDSLAVRLLLLGLLSSTEHYFRCVLARATSVCPHSIARAKSKPISMGAAVYLRADELGFALLESTNFSDSENVRKCTRDLLELDIAETSSVGTALKEYEKVCCLRHAAIHSNGLLSSKNIGDLGFLGRPRPHLQVELSLPAFQAISAVCLNVVRAYNRFVFDKLLNRMIKNQHISFKWGADKPLFTSLFLLFWAQDAPVSYANARAAHRAIHAIFKIEQAA